MMRAALWVLLIAGCSKSTDAIGSGSGSQRGHSQKREAAGGFSDELANSLGSDGSGGTDAVGAGAASADAPAPSVDAAAATARDDSASPPPPPPADARLAAAVSPDAAPALPPKVDPPKIDPKIEIAPPPPPARGPVPAELAAIKLSLLPNWERDVSAPGTIQLDVKNARVFTFAYGYEDPGAPADREAYKKWLADKKLLGPRADGTLLDRQRGSAWYLEGTGADGAPAFRYVVLYGGKRLVCGGSLYRDAASNPLGDIRDQSIIQAKQICETLAL